MKIVRLAEIREIIKGIARASISRKLAVGYLVKAFFATLADMKAHGSIKKAIMRNSALTDKQRFSQKEGSQVGGYLKEKNRGYFLEVYYGHR